MFMPFSPILLAIHIGLPGSYGLHGQQVHDAAFAFIRNFESGQQVHRQSVNWGISVHKSKASASNSDSIQDLMQRRAKRLHSQRIKIGGGGNVAAASRTDAHGDDVSTDVRRPSAAQQYAASRS